MVKDTFHFKSPDKSPEHFIDLFSRFYGPTMNAFDAAEKNGRTADLQRELEELFTAKNTSVEGTTIPATYLRVTVQR